VTERLDAYPNPRRDRPDPPTDALVVGDVTIGLVTPPARAKKAWTLPIGTQPGAAARVVHVTGRLALPRYGTFVVDHYAFLDADGRVLVPGVAASMVAATGQRIARFPPAKVEALVTAAGLGYVDDTITTPADLQARYRGLLPEGRALVGMYTVLGLFVTASALVFLGLAWDDRSDGAGFVAMLAVAALLALAYGAICLVNAFARRGTRSTP
jgi:hypothetical protein